MKTWVNAALAFLWTASVLFAMDWSKTLVDIEKSIPLLVYVNEEGGKGNCATTVVNEREDYVVTAAHCVEGKKALTIGSRHAEVVVTNALLDLAIVRTKGGSRDIPLAKSEPLVGTEVAVLGYPFNEFDNPVPTFGNVSRKSKDGRMWLNVDILFGHSGGPVINPQGELVGIVSAIKAQGATHLGVVVPLEHVRDFVEDYLYPSKTKK